MDENEILDSIYIDFSSDSQDLLALFTPPGKTFFFPLFANKVIFTPDSMSTIIKEGWIDLTGYECKNGIYT